MEFPPPPCETFCSLDLCIIRYNTCSPEFRQVVMVVVIGVGGGCYSGFRRREISHSGPEDARDAKNRPREKKKGVRMMS